MKTVLMVTLMSVLIGCGTDMTGIGTGVPDGGDDAGASSGRAEVDVGTPDSPAFVVVDASADAGGPDVAPTKLDTAPLIPDSVAPRRVGIPCRTSDQCGEHAGLCVDGRCVACQGAQCGMCVEGETQNELCPFKGVFASACSYCVEDPRLWCDRANPCPAGPCKSPDCR